MLHWMADIRLLILGCFLFRVKGHLDVVHFIDASPFTDPIYLPFDDYQESSPGDASSILWNVTSYSSLLPLLRRNGKPVHMSDLFPGSRRYKSADSGVSYAQPDYCSPRDTTVKLIVDKNNHNQDYFPRCTKIQRCGGCTSSPNLKCVPVKKERVSYKVVNFAMSEPVSETLEWKGTYATVTLDRHVTCRIQCTLTPSKCGPKKDYNERSCECRCRSYQRCPPPHLWDPEECECKCAEVLTCCKNGERCGLTFNKETCDCDLSTERHE